MSFVFWVVTPDTNWMSFVFWITSPDKVTMSASTSLNKGDKSVDNCGAPTLSNSKSLPFNVTF